MPPTTEARHLRLVKGVDSSLSSPGGADAERGRASDSEPPRAPLRELGESQLVALVRSGEMAAFEVLYRRHAPFALNLAVRIQGSAGDVEDIVHDAFLKAHQRLDGLRDPAAFRAWLGSIVVREVHSRLRRRKLLTTLGISTSAEPIDLDAVASRDASPELKAQLAQVYALLRTLPTADRIAWTLRYVEHHRLEAVAELCGCSLATAKRRIQRAQRFLGEHFVATEAVAATETPKAFVPVDNPVGSDSDKSLTAEKIQ